MKFLLRTRRNIYGVSTTAAKIIALYAADVSTAESNADALSATDVSTIALNTVAASATNVSMGDTRKLAEIAIITRAKLMAASTKAIGFAQKVR